MAKKVRPTVFNANRRRPKKSQVPADEVITEIQLMPVACRILVLLYNDGENLEGGMQVSFRDISKEVGCALRTAVRNTDALARLLCVKSSKGGPLIPNTYTLTSLGQRTAAELVRLGWATR